MAVIEISQDEIALFVLEVSIEIPVPPDDGAGADLGHDVVIVNIRNPILEFMAGEEAS